MPTQLMSTLHVMSTGLQGFLNSVVFLWGYPKYRRWLHNKMVYLCCYCLVDPYDKYYYKCMHSSGVEGEGTEPLLSDGEYSLWQ